MEINKFHSFLSTSMMQINPGRSAVSKPLPALAAESRSGAQDSDGAQLSRLGSVLNGLENGASIMRQHVQQAMGSVRSGTYRVDASELSRRIVGEALGSA